MLIVASPEEEKEGRRKAARTARYILEDWVPSNWYLHTKNFTSDFQLLSFVACTKKKNPVVFFYL